jgi:hypothetical protein
MAPRVLAFHVGDAAGGAHRMTWDGAVLRYERFRDGFEKLRESAVAPDAAAWAVFARAVERIDPFAWGARYEGEGRAGRWSLELEWDGRTARASGEGAYPEGFERLKVALWALAGNPPAL